METNISRIFSFMKKKLLEILKSFRQHPNKNLIMVTCVNCITMSLINSKSS